MVMRLLADGLTRGALPALSMSGGPIADRPGIRKMSMDSASFQFVVFGLVELWCRTLNARPFGGQEF